MSCPKVNFESQIKTMGVKPNKYTMDFAHSYFVNCCSLFVHCPNTVGWWCWWWWRWSWWWWWWWWWWCVWCSPPVRGNHKQWIANTTTNQATNRPYKCLEKNKKNNHHTVTAWWWRADTFTAPGPQKGLPHFHSVTLLILSHSHSATSFTQGHFHSVFELFT